ncbi:MAG: chorismate mutase [Oscillibacter sp.]|nr:chorismate mutase [Oscillibacter sp.]
MELSDIRVKIDEIDDQLLKLFLERMALSDEVAAYKNAHKQPILNKERERSVLAKVTDKAGDTWERYAYHLYSTLFELSRSRQAELLSSPTKVAAQVKASLAAGSSLFPQKGLVACQGVEGANSQVACDHILPRGNIVYVKTFDAVVSAVESGLCKFGVLPIENSSNGSVRAVYELLQDHKLSIVRTTRLCIRHELLGLPGAKMDQITEVYSHQQAIGQCSKFLNSLNGVHVVPCANTAMAAKMVAERKDPHVAAISSHPCAALYGLECINDDIQDSDNNYTRFICVTKDPVIYAGANRISLIIACDNKPGALYEILAKLAALDINMTKLESCPVTGRNFEFIFFLEIEASVEDPSVMAMLEELERCCANFNFLGCYAEV